MKLSNHFRAWKLERRRRRLEIRRQNQLRKIWAAGRLGQHLEALAWSQVCGRLCLEASAEADGARMDLNRDRRRLWKRIEQKIGSASAAAVRSLPPPFCRLRCPPRPRLRLWVRFALIRLRRRLLIWAACRALRLCRLGVRLTCNR